MKLFTDTEVAKECFLRNMQLSYSSCPKQIGFWLMILALIFQQNLSAQFLFFSLPTKTLFTSIFLIFFFLWRTKPEPHIKLKLLVNFLGNNDIEIKKYVCVCTDGCPTMTGSKKVFSNWRQNIIYQLSHLFTASFI